MEIEFCPECKDVLLWQGLSYVCPHCLVSYREYKGKLLTEGQIARRLLYEDTVRT